MDKVSRVVSALKNEGLRSTAWRTGKWLSTRYNGFSKAPLSTVYSDDVIAVDWSKPHDFNGFVSEGRNGKYRIAWVITPPGRTSGGHQNAFRFMKFLEDAGHDLTVYLYSPARYPVVSVHVVREMMSSTTGYPDLAAELRVYDPSEGFAPGYDALVASDWEASYAAYRYEGEAKRFYFAQDYEPSFFAAGSDFVLAENSYRLGFHGLVAGGWLASKLRDEFGMSCDHFDFAVDVGRYNYLNAGARNEVVFYVRPPTPRRASEFGLLALQELHRRRPDVVINLVGWDMSGYDVPFPYVNHSALDIAQLNDIYNRCAAGLVLSLTNMSLLPMELMASGVVPVVNDAPNVRGVLDSPNIEYVPMSPKAIADRIESILDRPDAVEHAAAIARSVESVDWETLGRGFVADFVAAMRTAL
ncbi:rhamnosyltransferase WsaF family glycosyltransferase [Luethyella okanaganae]|uniref:Glycosyltransferase family 1 protein n=1 Tax=Luethyella okanaganae TaxID=69372 RepID=A0ABW1VCP6_9MICO